MSSEKKINLKKILIILPLVLFFLEIFLKPLILRLRPFGIYLSGPILDLTYILIILFSLPLIYLVHYLLYNKKNKEEGFNFTNNRSLKTLNNNSILIPLTFGIIAILLIFSSKNLFNSEIITQYDYSFHYYYSWYFNNYLIPEFNSVFGFSNYYYAGHPILSFYPSGIYYFIYFMSNIGININISIRFFMILSLLGYFLIPWLFLKRNNENLITIIFSQLGLLALSQWLLFFDQGLFPYMLSTFIAFYLINDYAKYIKNLKSKKKNRFTKYKHIVLILILSQIHFLSLIFFFLYTIISLINQKRLNKQAIKRMIPEIKIIFLYLIFAILFEMSFFLPNFFISTKYFLPNDKLGILGYISFLISNGQAVNFLFTIPFYIIYLAVLGLYIKNDNTIVNIGMKKMSLKVRFQEFTSKNYSNEIIFLFLIFLILLILPIFSYFGLYFINSIGISRFVTYVIPILCIFVGKTMSKFWDRLKEINIKSEHFFLLFFIAMFSEYSFFSFYNFLYPSVFPEDGKYNITSWSQFNSHEEIDYTELKQNVSDVYDWIELNTDKNSRILIEESGLPTGYKWGGYTLSLLAPQFDRSFIGGYYHIFFTYYNKTFKSTAYEGRIFSINVSGTFDSEDNTEALVKIEEKCKDFNVKYMIVWSQNIIGFLDRNFQKFDLVDKFDGFYIYSYKNAIESYLRTNSSEMVFKDFILTQSKISFNIENASQNDKVQVSIQDYYNWNVYLNDSIIQTQKDSDLITFSISDSGNYSVEINWEKSSFEEIGNLLFDLGLIYIPIGIIMELIRTKIRKKS